MLWAGVAVAVGVAVGVGMGVGMVDELEMVESALPDDDARNVKTRLLNEAGAQMNVMPQVIDAQLQILESDRRRVTG